jgi:hypothetical protein
VAKDTRDACAAIDKPWSDLRSAMLEQRPWVEVAPSDPESFAHELEADVMIVRTVRGVKPEVAQRFDDLAGALTTLATLARSYGEARVARRADDVRARHEALVTKAFEASGVDAALFPLCFGRPNAPPSEPFPRVAPPRDPAAPLPMRLSVPELLEGLDAARVALRACYEAGRRSDPRLAGTLTVRLVIRHDGTVASVKPEVRHNGPLAWVPSMRGIPLAPVTDPRVVGCALRTFQRLKFPPTQFNRGFPITYPLVMTPEDAVKQP